VNRALDASNEEIIQVNRRVDQLHEKVGKGRPDLDFETFKAIVEKKMMEMDQKHHDAFKDLDGENIKLRAQI